MEVYKRHYLEISIHALLAESDAIDVFLAVWAVISIHALLAESDRPAFFDTAQHIYFYPRSPCGERLRLLKGSSYLPIISIHALLAESDDNVSVPNRPKEKFLSTLSLRRAT